ncbi:MAG: GNAT family N-acetyltransferase [Eubacterium sp.]|nr:GNAT family N-acetyltransferase [Eubacterium sp.]
MDKIIETTSYDDEIIALWQEAFGDSREDIVFFLENAKNISCLCYYGDCLCSMLFLVDCTVNGMAFKYIYAACTAVSARKKGYMSKLLEYAQKKYNNVLLIPADKELVNYYSNRKFKHKIDIKDILFNECDEIKEYLFEGCSLNEPIALAYKGE